MKSLKALTARIQQIIGISLLMLVIALTAIQPIAAFAQTPNTQGWTPPVNISRTGGATNPVMVVDSHGVKHAIWVDAFNGFMYSKGDSSGWSTPVPVTFPFSPAVNPRSTTKPVYPTPKLIADPNGRIHAFWIDEKGIFYTSDASEAGFGYTYGWSSKRVVDVSATAFDVTMDTNGTIHIAYIHNIDSNNAPAGVYYRMLTRSFYLGMPVTLSTSSYFRSITADSANINITTSPSQDAQNVYVVWDNQPRNRVSLVQSMDAGKTWGQPVIMDGPEVSSGPVVPRDIKVGANGGNAVVVWQVDQPGNNCIQNYKWTGDEGKSWQGPGRMMTNIQGCADSNQFLAGPNGTILLMTRVLGQVYLHAWNGSRWSDPQYEEILSSFIDQETYNLVTLNSQSAVISDGNTLNVIGADTGAGGDIWLTSQQINSVDSWFSAPDAWTLPATVATSSGDHFASGLVADQNNFVHMVWSEDGGAANGSGGPSLMYARWDGKNWTAPLAILGGVGRNINPPSMDVSNNKLYVVFSDQTSGEIDLMSANTNEATSATAWAQPAALPVPRSGADSPQIHAAPDGSLYVVYSVPINENRGIYIVHSTDGGANWSSPVMVFDAAKAGWPVVDYPQLTFTDAQHLYLLFTQYAQPGRTSPQGLYYTSSADGGQTWAAAQQVTNQPTVWSDIRGVAPGTVHVAWEESNNGSYTIWHNTTSDNGQTWAGKSSVNNLAQMAVLSSLTVDSSGQVHLLQSTNEVQGNLTFTHWVWHAPQWSIADVNKFQPSPNTNENANALMSAITPDGRLVLVYSLSSPSPNDPTVSANTVYAIQRSLSANGQAQAQAAGAAPVVAANPTAAPTAQPTLAPTAPAPTAPSLLAGPVKENLPVPKTAPANKIDRYMGLILGLGVTIVIVIIITIFGAMSVKKRGLR